MRKFILSTFILIALFACNNHGEHPGNVPQNSTGGDSVAQAAVMREMNSAPNKNGIYVKVNTKQVELTELSTRQINSFIARATQPAQKFTVNPAEPISVRGEKGTRIMFDAGSFVTKAGLPVNEPIQLHLKECYGLGEMLAEDITTTIGTDILESKGALYVSATTLSGKPVELAEGSSYDVVFPFNTREKGFSFYYGDFDNKGNIAWSAEPADKKGKIVIDAPVFEFAGADFQQYMFSRLEFPDEARRNEIASEVDVEFMIDEDGRVNNVGVTGNYKMFKDAVSKAFDNVPNWTPATSGGKPIAVVSRMKVTFNTRSRNQVSVDYSPNNITALAGLKEKDQKNRKDINNCLATNTCSLKSFKRMGWFTCAKVVANNAQPKADVVVTSDTYTDVKLVLKKHKSIINAKNAIGVSRFDGVQQGTQVYIVGIRHQNGKTFFAFQPATLQAQNVVQLKWEAVTAEQLRASLLKVGS